MLPLCADQGVGVIPWSPLARGRLARPWDAETERTRTDNFGKTLYDKMVDADRAIIEEVGKIAAERDVPRAQVALAWMLRKPGVTAPIVGASKPGHLTDAVSALEITLSDDETERLEAPYVPHPVKGHS